MKSRKPEIRNRKRFNHGEATDAAVLAGFEYPVSCFLFSIFFEDTWSR